MFHLFAGSLLPLLVLSVVDVNRCYGLQIPPICNASTCNCTRVGEKHIAVNCAFPRQQDIKIDANFIPPEVDEFEITQAGGVVLEARSFSKLNFLRKVTIKDVRSLVIRRDAFINLVAPQFFLEIRDCGNVEIESKAFYITRGPVAVTIEGCETLKYNSEAISWISEAVVRDVKDVDFAENSFSQNSEKSVSRQGYSTKIILQRVATRALPENVFASSAVSIKLLDSKVGEIKKNAFSALEIYAVRIENTTIDTISSGAFSERTLLTSLQLVDTSIRRVCAGAILSAVTNFTFYDSRVETVEKEAFNMSTMLNVYFFNNIFEYVEKRGITLKGWRKAIIENNTLRNLDAEAINVPYIDERAEPQEFHFVGNILENLKDNSLKFDIDETTPYYVSENIFLRACRCDMATWMRSSIGGNGVLIESLYNESYCAVNAVFAKCFKQPEGFMKVANFTEQVCNADETIVCVEKPAKTAAEQNPNINKAIGILHEKKIDHERKMIGVVLAAGLAGAVVMLAVSVYMWIRKKGYQVSDCLVSGVTWMASKMTAGGDLGRATSASSITRVSVHEYAEVWPQKLLSTEDETYVCEDKATQTLPEELTQELLQHLREKLDDPENYSEARNMIEHLYDLIKVEESCNNNALGEEFADINLTNDDMDNVYDVIRPGKRVRRCDRSFKTLAHKGTRAPSPDKLSPLSFTTSSFGRAGPSVSDYMEPTDRRTYTYQMPYDQCSTRRIGDVVLAEYKDPKDVEVAVYSELTSITGRPLPVTPGSQ